MAFPNSEAKRFVIVSGLPGSGKSTLARRLSAFLDLPVIDKDDILERLFESQNIGDAPTRRSLSRESDGIMRVEASASGGAILVSFWHVPGMPTDSGTPTDWIAGLSDRVVNVACVCPPAEAARRFAIRIRHPGHLDASVPRSTLDAMFDDLARLPPLDVGIRVEVDTTGAIATADVARLVMEALNR